MSIRIKWLLGVLGMAYCVIIHAASWVDLKVTKEAEQLILSLGSSQNIAAKVFSLENPHRLVIDLPSGRLRSDLKVPNNHCVRGMRVGQHTARDQRLVLDLYHACQFELSHHQQKGRYHTVIRVQPAVSESLKITHFENKTSPLTQKLRPFVIAIDPGHGGKDPGAIGKRGTYEKTVVLQIAQKLQYRINQQKNMRAFLTREGDYYLPLKERSAKARKRGADLFISIHADAFKDPTAQGASVFVLSQKGASSEAARWLAETENQSDLIGGVKLNDKDDLLASILLDLSQTASQQASREIALELLSSLSRITSLHKKNVESANFVVLRSPDMPSILVETGFISHHEGEKQLRSSAYQDRIAEAILKGIHTYFHNKTLPIALPEHQWLAQE